MTGERYRFIEVGSIAWKSKGVCVVGTLEELPDRLDMFFPNGRGKTAVAAKKVCAKCTVTKECYQYAVENDIEDGVWGGVTMSMRANRQTKPVIKNFEQRMLFQ